MIVELLTLENQLKIWHWQTTSFAEHKALDKIHDSIEERIDMFIEAFQGKYARIKSENEFNIQLENYTSSDNIISFVNKNIEYLIGMDKGLEEGYNDELLNIRDEIVSDLQKLKYLLTLK